MSFKDFEKNCAIKFFVQPPATALLSNLDLKEGLKGDWRKLHNEELYNL
jgi:hypothetical protein